MLSILITTTEGLVYIVKTGLLLILYAVSEKTVWGTGDNSPSFDEELLLITDASNILS